jgi:serine/threonine protein kinase
MHRFVANDRYTAESLLGEGASARVYAARNADGNRVALKLLSSDRSDDFEALRREFLVPSHLDHPLVARVFDFGRLGAERAPYIAEELVEGQSLVEANSCSVRSVGWVPVGPSNVQAPIQSVRAAPIIIRFNMWLLRSNSVAREHSQQIQRQSAIPLLTAT